MEPLLIHCIRHGESVANAGGASSDPISIPLTDLGLAQARAVSRKLASLSPGLIICSPCVRAQQTAAPTRELLPDVPFETWPIEEFNFLAPRWANSTREERRPFSQAYWQKSDPSLVDGIGAESFAGFLSRVKNAMAALERIGHHRTILAFGHGQFFLALRWLIQINTEGLATPETMRDFYRFYKTETIPNCSGFTAVFNGRAWSIAPEG